MGIYKGGYYLSDIESNIVSFSVTYVYSLNKKANKRIESIVKIFDLK